MSNPQIQTIIEGSIQVKQALLNDQHLVTEIEKIVHAITAAFKKGNAVYFAGILRLLKKSLMSALETTSIPTLQLKLKFFAVTLLTPILAQKFRT